jgi:hypothetical protein
MAVGWKARARKREKADRPDCMMEAIALLLSLGWTTAGKTPREEKRFGDKIVEMGERRRFILPYTPRCCTVGRKTTCFYRVDGNMQPIDHMNVHTKDLDEVRRIATPSPHEHGEQRRQA